MSQKKKTGGKSSIIGLILYSFLLCFYIYCYKNGYVSNEIWNTYSSKTEVTENNVSSEIEIYYFDVGQADSILITNQDKYMLIDAGNNADGRLIVQQLKSMGISKIDYLIGTHPHEDHIGGLDDVIDNFKIGALYMPYREEDSKAFEDVLDSVSNKNMKIKTPKAGTKFSLGEANCIILSALSDVEDTNDSSIVLQISFENTKYLFTGDLTSNVESEINWQDIDVLKVAHHGSRYSTSKAFLEVVKPEIAIISDGPNNDYDHPHKELLKRLKDIKAEIYRTDLYGTIHLKSDGELIEIESLDIILDGNKR